MALKHIGPKPRRFKYRPYTPSGGYWYAWIAGASRPFTRWTITDLAELDRLYAEKKEHFEVLRERTAEAAVTSLSKLERNHLLVKELFDLYLEARIRHVDHADPGRRISRVTFTNYAWVLRWVAKQIGGLPVQDLKPLVFTKLAQQAAAQYGPSQCNSIVTRTRMVFHWAVQNEMIDAAPAYGTEFVSTNEAVRLDHVRQKPVKFFAAKQIKKLLEHADRNMRAMIYLGINCAYLQSDCAELPISFGDHPTNRLHLGKDPYIRFDRVKTGERRKCTLWPETVQALQAVIGDRTDGPVFVTRRGFALQHQKPVLDDRGAILHYAKCDPTPKKFRDLCQRAKLRPQEATESHPLFGLGFSALRTTFETVAFNNTDLSVAHQAAIAWIMGHRISGVSISRMADRYLQDLDTSTLACVTDHVRGWLLKKV